MTQQKKKEKKEGDQVQFSQQKRLQKNKKTWVHCVVL